MRAAVVLALVAFLLPVADGFRFWEGPPGRRCSGMPPGMVLCWEGPKPRQRGPIL